jgi:hypothetical protein
MLFGLHSNDAFENFTENMPLSAAFHRPDGSEPVGDNGQFDLAYLSSRDGSTKYATGTFKLYKWNGRNRMRLSTYDGTEVMRVDWSIEDGSLVLADNTLTQWEAQPEDIADCLAFEVNSPDDSLSVASWPLVTVSTLGDSDDTYEIRIGSAIYDSDVATITVTSTEHQFEARAKTDSRTTIIRARTKAPRRGQVLRGTSPIASIVCR